MVTGDLLNHLRMRLVAMGVNPPFDRLLITHIDNAYNLFINEMGGVSDEEDVVVSAEETELVIPDYVLKIKAAHLQDGTEVTIINRGDTRLNEFNTMFGKTGEIKYVLIGSKRGIGKVAYSPIVDTTISFDVDRLPVATLDDITDLPDDVPRLFQLDILDLALAQVLSINSDLKIRAQAGDFEARGYAKAREARDHKAREQSKLSREITYGGI